MPLVMPFIIIVSDPTNTIIRLTYMVIPLMGACPCQVWTFTLKHVYKSINTCWFALKKKIIYISPDHFEVQCIISKSYIQYIQFSTLQAKSWMNKFLCHKVCQVLHAMCIHAVVLTFDPCGMVKFIVKHATYVSTLE